MSNKPQHDLLDFHLLVRYHKKWLDKIALVSGPPVAHTKLTCIIKPFRLDAVLARLEGLTDVTEVLVAEVRGYGRQKGHLDLYRGSEYDLTFLPKICLEVYVSDHAEAVMHEILQVARTGRIGDGKIFCTTLESYP